MQQASSPVLQQQLRSLHPGALHTLHQSPDGSLYPQTLPELQNNLHTHGVYHHPQQPYALSGPPQPPSHVHAHALPVHQFEQHSLPPAVPYAPFPASYQHATSPRFVDAPPPLPAQAPQYHTSPLPPPPRPVQQRPLPPPLPILTVPHHVPRHVEHVQPPPQQQVPDGYVYTDSRWSSSRALQLLVSI